MKKILLPVFVLGFTITSCLTENPTTDNQINNNETVSLPLREVQTLEFFINRVKSDSTWMYLTEEKAKKQGITLDEMLKLEGQFLLDQDAAIVKIENEIIKNPEWLEFVSKKAEEQGTTLDSMIRNDANYMYLENLNKVK
jgi:hypothetical protein